MRKALWSAAGALALVTVCATPAYAQLDTETINATAVVGAPHMRFALLTIAMLLGLVITCNVVRAQQSIAMLMVSLPTQARLSVSSTSVLFPDSDPESTPLVASVPAGLAISARARVPRNSRSRSPCTRPTTCGRG
jgi:hypothetical protein